MLLLDDIQFLANEEKAEEVFIYLLDKLHNEKEKIIVVSANRHSNKIEGLNAKIDDKCNWGLLADIRKIKEC